MAIQLLSDSLISKIAAGEVVERPSSVVKELVENALDANATEIEVELQDGGKKSILVRDNGCGIPPDEVKLAVARHATSKISSVDDLFSIQTMGFRGEALASIGSIAKLTLTSKLKDHDVPAREIQVEDGQIVSEMDTGHPDGTSVLVKYLFFHTPARLKFLKSPETEVAHAEEVITRAALAHPEVGFRLTHNGKKIVSVSRGQDLSARVADLFGAETAQYTYPISHGREGVEICGLAGHPQISRSQARQLYLFVNGRPVRDKVLTHAVMEAYRNFLMHGRYPFAVVFLKVPSVMVDVNVHPAKTEVRFSQSSVMHNMVVEAVRKTIGGEPWKKLNPMDVGAAPCGRPQYPDPDQYPYQGKPQYQGQPQGVAPTGLNQLFIDAQRSWETPTAHAPLFETARPGTLALRDLPILGQLMGTYIVCDAGENLVLVDQHAAHERIGFEKLLAQFKAGGLATQRLLIPINFDLNPSETEIFKKYVPELAPFGMEIDFFGGNTFVAKSLPTLFKKQGNLKSLVMDLVGDVLEKGRLTSLTDSFHDVLARMSCHGAIRAHDKLAPEEMRSLLIEMDETAHSSFCPHGRPAQVQIPRYEIEKWFKRIA